MPITVTSPVRQVVTGRAGVYEVQLLELKDMSVKELHDFAAANSYDNPNNEERETMFWKSLASPSPWHDPIYGADTLGSLFGDNVACGWNVNSLDSVLRLLGAEVPGVTQSYLYVGESSLLSNECYRCDNLNAVYFPKLIGTWRAMFAFHTEDLNLYSINYLHTGCAKVTTQFLCTSNRVWVTSEYFCVMLIGHAGVVCYTSEQRQEIRKHCRVILHDGVQRMPRISKT